jgi:hypothetical protein
MSSNWSQFLSDYRKKHPKLSLKEAMVGASPEYKKKKNKAVKGKGIESKKVPK